MDDPIWRQAFPGLIGILLHLAGKLGSKHHYATNTRRAAYPRACAFHATCPLCDGPAIVGVLDAMQLDDVGIFNCFGQCPDSVKNPASEEATDSSARDSESEAPLYEVNSWQRDIVLALGVILKVIHDDPDTDFVQEVLAFARNQFEQMSPVPLDLSLPQREVADTAVAALARVPELLTANGHLLISEGGTFRRVDARALDALLGEILRPSRNGKPVRVPKSLSGTILAQRSWPGIKLANSEAAKVEAEAKVNIAKEALLQVLTDASLLAGTSVTSAEVLGHDPSRVDEALTSLGRTPGVKSLGYVFRSMQREPSSRISAAGAARGVTRWKVL